MLWWPKRGDSVGEGDAGLRIALEPYQRDDFIGMFRAMGAGWRFSTDCGNDATAPA